ncbi:MAG: hypothetical protein ABIS50_10255 [Luteolibacter sp.]|uniref:hypothetical protein n=1 Tax=Luteolibacter sp. TaxID=1962973 RepID=UPI003265328E
MKDKLQRWQWVLLASAAAAFGAWTWSPGSSVDRTLFTTVAGSSANGALFISGQGSREKPWTLRTFAADVKTDRRQSPVIVSLGDDLAGFFQSTPPAPIDLAVIFTNFQRLGAKKAATAAVLAWEKPDPIGLAALEKSLDGFDSLVMAAPLSRGVVSAAIPAPFRRSSIAVERIHGDTSALPIVNRLPIPGISLGRETTIAGFSSLESEKPGEFFPLMARWEDRVVLSFSLLTVMQRLNLPLDGLEVRLGEFLKLGPEGPIVPIDEFGRLTLPVTKISPYQEISAEALIDGGDDLFPKEAPDPVILRDDQSSAEPATRAFSKSLSSVIAAIASNRGLTEGLEYKRLSQDGELAMLVVAVLGLTGLCGASDFARYLGVLALAGGSVAAQWIAFGAASLWLPVLPVLAAAVAAIVVAKWATRNSAEAELVVVSPAPIESPVVSVPFFEPTPEVEPAPKPKAKPPAKKAVPRKTAAKKTAAVKEPPAEKPKPVAKKPARKAVKPKAPPAEEPPENP